MRSQIFRSTASGPGHDAPPAERRPRAAALGAVAAGFVVSIALVGCGSTPADETSSATSESPSPSQDQSSGQKASQEAPEPVTITIADFEFDAPASVSPGAEVEVVNDDSSTHSVTSEDDAFTEVVVEGGGATGSFTAPSEPGTYSYVCKFHPEMVAKLVVK